jgi:hypothetical protein
MFTNAINLANCHDFLETMYTVHCTDLYSTGKAYRDGFVLNRTYSSNTDTVNLLAVMFRPRL